MSNLTYVKKRNMARLILLQEEIDKRERIKRCSTSLQEFAKTYFSHYISDANGVAIPFCKAHIELFNKLEEDKMNKRLVRVLPRNHAKSTIISFFYPLWCVCYKKKRFIVLISDTIPQARFFVSNISSEIESNELLIKDFGLAPARDTILNRTVSWTDSELVFNTGCRIIGKGSGSKLRGLRDKEARPDLIIVDDLENDESVSTLEQRRKLWEWFTSAVMNLGGSNGCDYILTGTILHYDSLLKKLENNSSFDYKLWKALPAQFAPLWKEYWSYGKLKEKKKTIGEKAWSTEWQNDPSSSENSVFKLNEIQFFDYEEIWNNIQSNPSDYTFYGAIDLSVGNSKRADYTAIVTVAFNERTNYIYVIDAFYDILQPSKSIQKVLQYCVKYPYRVFVVETNGFQSMIRKDLQEKARHYKSRWDAPEQEVFVPIKAVEHRVRKEIRLESLQPMVYSGKLQFRKDFKKCYPELIEEMLCLGSSRRDDVIDGLEMAVSQINTTRFKLIHDDRLPY